MNALTRHKTLLTWSAVTLGVLLITLALLTLSMVGYARLYEGRIFPGVRILHVRLDGMNVNEARDAVQKAIDQSLRTGLRFQYASPTQKPTASTGTRGASSLQEVTIDTTTVAPNDPDVARDLIRYNIDPALLAAARYGRTSNLVIDTVVRWRARLAPVELPVEIHIDEPRIHDIITDATQDTLPEPINANIRVTWNSEMRVPESVVMPESASGFAWKFDAAFKELRAQARILNFDPIVLRGQTAEPTITSEDVRAAFKDVPILLMHAPFVLTDKERSVTITTSTLAEWIRITDDNNRIHATLDPELFAAGVRRLFPALEQTAKKGSLVLQNGTLVSFEPGTGGASFDDRTTRANILSSWDTTSTFPLVIVREEPALIGADPERLGIREIIGIGRSNFSGSPVNRRKNIANGIKKVNGSLIPPGEEFSLLKALGPIEETEGWLPELVIKGNETKPELGGGLCQIGTTTFRAALASGLPIIERQNHSYRVRYYEPAGTDATIYDPKPDFRFKNDTPGHLFIHAFSKGDDITYEFWGTRDGRVTAQTKPKISNIVQPPPKKIVETLDLPPGKTKCTETAHAGADAEFTYTVTYADGTTKEQVFRSHYRPWQAVCLVGVEKLSEPVTDASAPTASSSSTDPGAVDMGGVR
jgi:vancomycin resistance protein YoaR